MHRLESIKESLINSVQSQMGHLDSVDAKELGEAVDMIKDMAEAIYYCTITKAMKDADEAKKYSPKENFNYNPDRMYYNEYNPPYNMNYNMRDNSYNYNPRGDMWMDRSDPIQDRTWNRYTDQMSGSNGGSNGGSNSNARDSREGRSPTMRRYYMESKAAHKGTAVQLKDLENYLKELSMDITEMIEGATQEEKSMLQQKLNTLANKII